MVLEVGEVYLNIQILGKNGLKLAAFKNKEKAKNPKAPDYKGDGIAVWISKKQPGKQEAQEAGL